MEKQFSVSVRSVKSKFLSLVANSYQFSLKSLRLILAFGAFLLVPSPAFPETIITESDYTLIVNDSKRVVQLLLPTAEFNLLAQPGYPATSDIRNLTTRIYSHFNDQFDFLIFISNQDTTPAGKYSGVYFEAKNDITGIGVRLFDDSGYYGSLGQL